MKKLLLTALLIFLLAGKGWADSILVGTDTEADSNISPNYVVFHKFTASATGNAAKIRLFSRANGNAKVAIYSDSAGEPNSLLASASGAATSGQWNEYTISSVAITSGTVYWLAENIDTDGVAQYLTGDGRRYKAATYSSYTFPATYDGTGFTTDGTGSCSISAYSVTAAASPRKHIIFIQ